MSRAVHSAALIAVAGLVLKRWLQQREDGNEQLVGRDDSGGADSDRCETAELGVITGEDT